MTNSVLVILPLLVAWTAVVMVPGPNFFSTIHFAAQESTRAGIRVAWGVAIGTAIWSTVAIAALSTLVVLLPWMTTVLRIAGSLVLALLGLRILLVLLRRRRATGISTTDRSPPGRPLLTGLLSDLANPKAAIFWTSIVAAALPADATISLRVLCVVAVTSIAFAWYALLALAVNTRVMKRAYALHRTSFDAVAGVMLLVLAAGVALS